MLKLGRLMLLLALAVMLAGIGACSGYVAVGVRDSDYWCDCPEYSYRHKHDPSWYQGSIDGDAEWVAGRGRRTLDKIWVVPGNHATASLYAYTPWVLRGSGGNWLVWNVTRKMERHARALGVLVETAVDPATDPTGDQ